MARDLDFARPRTVRPNSSAPVRPPVTNQPSAPTPAPTKTRSRIGWLVVLLIILGLALLTIGIYYQTSRANRVSTPPISATKKTTSTAVPVERDNILAGAKSEFSVQIYDSGAGKDTLNKVIKLLKDQHYDVVNLDQSQFNYDQTMIWYKKGFSAQAEKVADVLKNRDTKLTESSIGGVFDILIWLGKN